MAVLGISNQVTDFILQVYTYLGDRAFDFFALYSRPILDFMHNVFKLSFDYLLYLTIVLTFMHLLIVIAVSMKKSKKEKPIKEYPTVTIQIPTYNELAAINCAKRCLDFDYPKDRFKIMIGDDSSDKAVSKKIDAFAAKYKGRIQVTRRGHNIGYKPGNLNHMLKYTNGEYIVIFDSDFLPKKDFLRRIIAPFTNDPKIDAVQSRWITKNFSQNLSSVIGGLIPMFSHRLGLPFLDMVGSNGFIAGSAEAVKKKTLLDLGGWKNGALTEDIEYSLRLTKLGRKIVYLEKLECECESPFTVKDLCKQQMRWAYGVIKALKTHAVGLLFNRKIPFIWKYNPMLLLSGYLITFLFFALGVLGALSIITAVPQPIDWSRFFSETGRNMLLTSGYLFTGIILLALSKRIRETGRMIVASFSIGLLVIYTVTIGIFKAVFNRQMTWFMLAKKGNVSRVV